MALEKHFNPLVKALFDLPIPVVAAVNGPCAGAGCSLALAADIVIAARSAYFLQAFVNIGLIPDAGATWLLPRLAGRARAMEMMMLGERIPGRTGARMGPDRPGRRRRGAGQRGGRARHPAGPGADGRAGPDPAAGAQFRASVAQRRAGRGTGGPARRRQYRGLQVGGPRLPAEAAGAVQRTLSADAGRTLARLSASSASCSR